MATEQDTPSGRLTWWAATLAVAATYVYFLLFAEFALLELMRAFAAPEDPGIQKVMMTLGAGGLAGCLLGGARFRPGRMQADLTASFLTAALAALGTLAAPGLAAKLVAVAGVGVSLGWLTVTLATGLRRCIGPSRFGLSIGAGTGLAYAICNLPIVFSASAANQTILAAFVAAAGSLAVPFLRPTEPAAPPGEDIVRAGPASRWILIFLALVWLDSAAFYVIQHHPEWRSATWTGADRLGLNAFIHLSAALVAGWALDRGALRAVVTIGLTGLVAACAGLALRTQHFSFVQLGYTAGVSFYSVALVFYPASKGRPWLAAALFAVSGWIGSALGIGMAHDLQHIPVAMVVTAGAAGLALLTSQRRLAGWAVAAIFAGAAVQPADAAPAESQIDRGRAVYIAEGCIHCHSQYLRHGTLDTDRWGEAPPFASVVAGAPPLLGNRRQGPDLATVGRRRTAEWNRLHLMAPRQVSPGSRMPSYAHLFPRDGSDSAGEALVAYLGSLGTTSPGPAKVVRGP